MQRILSALATWAIAAVAVAQSPLTTTFSSNNGGTVGGAVYFDLTVNVPHITIIGLDLNLTGTGSIEVYTCPSTRAGNLSNPAAWTLVSTGGVAGAVLDVPSPVSIAPFVLPAGTHGIAFKAIGAYHNYTNGNGTNQTYSTAELTLNAGEASHVAFAGTPYSPRVVNCSITYAVGGGGSMVLATKTNFGQGCVASHASFYENFATSASFDLSNTAMSMLRTGTGYRMTPGTTTYVAPSATATVLALTDDSETAVALSTPLVTATGATSSLTVCSNGYVSVASGNGIAWTPDVAAFLDAPQTGWWCWHDNNPMAASSGHVKFEEIGGVAYITWDGVYDYGGTGPANANTYQMQFDLARGHVHFVWQQMSVLGNGRLVGYSPGGVSLDAGNRDISATLPATFSVIAQDILPLALSASSRPVQTTSINLDTDNIGATALFGAITLGLNNPAFDLASFGMTGCTQYTNNLVTALYLPFGSPTASVAFTVPSARGLHIFAQSFAFDPAAGLTQLGAVASNGVELLIGDY